MQKLRTLNRQTRTRDDQLDDSTGTKVQCPNVLTSSGRAAPAACAMTLSALLHSDARNVAKMLRDARTASQIFLRVGATAFLPRNLAAELAWACALSWLARAPGGRSAHYNNSPPSAQSATQAGR